MEQAARRVAVAVQHSTTEYPKALRLPRPSHPRPQLSRVMVQPMPHHRSTLQLLAFKPRTQPSWSRARTVQRPSPRYGAETRAVIPFATLVVCGLPPRMMSPHRLTHPGLYYKLHGVHRPVTMKKSVIKRRKRVVPAPQATQASGADAAAPSGSPEPDHPSPAEEAPRGSINPDGSVNLGLRIRDEQGRSLLPEPVPSSRGGPNGLSDLNAYSSLHPFPHDASDSLHNENRLPPMTSYPPPAHARPSVSPSSFLSPSRKRSFSATEMEPLPPIDDVSASAPPKRLSSIKSILNPGSSENEDAPGRYQGSRSPSLVYGNPVGTGSAVTDGERAKLERREMLQREAERMREALKAKERELEEMG